MTLNDDIGEIDRMPASKWKKIVFVAILSVMVLSTVARALMASSASEEPVQEQVDPALAPNSLTGGLPGILDPNARKATPVPDEPTALETALPYLSEGSFFALIGFALGYTSKKLIKLMLIFLAIFFIGIQALSYSGVLEVDWSKAIDLANNLILNLKENETITEVLKDKLPTAGALIAGYWLGFRKG